MYKRIAAVTMGLLLFFTSNVFALTQIYTSIPIQGEYIAVVNGNASDDGSANTGVLPPNASPASPPPGPTGGGGGVHSSNIPADVDSVPEGTMRITYDANGNPMYQMDGDRFFKYRVIDPASYKESKKVSVDEEKTVGMEKEFWVSDYTGNQPEDYKQKFILMDIGEKCYVWYEKDSDGKYDTQAVKDHAWDIMDTFDNTIYQPCVDTFGNFYDKDGSGKVTILLFDIKDGYDPNVGGSVMGGYFDPDDIFVYDERNRAAVINIDTYPSSDQSQKSTLAHEFTHMIVESYRAEKGFGIMPIPTYVNEGLAMAAEHMIFGPLYDRINYFNNDSKNIIKNGKSLYWDGSLESYALSYIFMQYVRTQTETKIFKNIIESEDRGDARKGEISNTVVATEMEKYPGFSSLALPELLTDFAIATVMKENLGVYGFKGEAFADGIARPLYTGSGTDLPSGGILVKKITAPFTPAISDSDIVFTGFGRVTQAVSVSDLQYEFTDESAAASLTLTRVSGAEAGDSAIFAVYDGDVLVGYQRLPLEFDSDDKCTVNFDVETIRPGKRMKIFVWDFAGLSPIIENISEQK